MFTKEMIDKIHSFLRDNLDIMFKFEFNGLLLLNGGAIKGLIMNTPIKDYDFQLLTQEEDNIMEFINKYNLKYEKKIEHGYTIFYNDLVIGINPLNDLGYCGILNTDMIFYDINRKQFIPIGIKWALKKRKVIDLGYFGYPRYEQRLRLKRRTKTAQEFIKFMTIDNSRVRVVRKNKYYTRMLIGFLRHPSKIKKLFRR